MNTRQIIESAQVEVGTIVQKSKRASRTIIKRYHASFAGGFTDWIGKTRLRVRHPYTKWVLDDNLACESAEDHIGMLRRFAKSSGALPNNKDYEHVEEVLYRVRAIFKNSATAGLVGTALCATLEATSLVFVPNLKWHGKRSGCGDFEYINKHGVADVEHTKVLIKALQHEQTIGYEDPLELTGKGADRAVDLIRRIYA